MPPPPPAPQDWQRSKATAMARSGADWYDGGRVHRKEVHSESSASSFLPYQAHDLVYTSLRLAVFRIDPTSASPVAQVIRDESNDGVVFKLLEDLYIPARGPQLANPASYNGPLRATAARLKRYQILCQRIAKARVTHAERLRDQGLCDVDIIFKCEQYQVEPFKGEKQRVEAAGARSYHVYPFREKEKEMALSVIVDQRVLEALYPADLREKLNVTIKTNTAPAPSAEREPTVHRVPTAETIFPYEKPMSSTGNDSKADELTERREQEAISRARSESVLKVMKAPKGDWHLNSSASRCESPQPRWKAGEAPFIKHPRGHDDEWFRADFQKRQNEVSEYNKTWVDSGVGFTRNSTDESPSIPLTNDVDDPSIQSESGTLVAGSESEAPAAGSDPQRDQQDAQEPKVQQYEAAYANYMDLVREAKRFYDLSLRLRQLANKAPNDEQVAFQIRQMDINRLKLRHELRIRKTDLEQSARACDREPDESDMDFAAELEWRLQHDIDKKNEESQAAQAQKQALPPVLVDDLAGNTPRPPQTDAWGPRGVQHFRPGDRRLRTAAAPPSTDNPAPDPTSRENLPPRPDEVIVGEDTIPFPPYVDPITAGAAPQQQAITHHSDARIDRSAGSSRSNGSKDRGNVV